MRIREGHGLDYDDVLIVPQRSSLDSRTEVKLTRTYKFPHSPQQLVDRLGIIAANMDTIGTIKMAQALNQEDCFTALHKYNTQVNISNLLRPAIFVVEQHGRRFVTTRLSTFVTVGLSSEDMRRLLSIENSEDDLPFLICLDAANGYTTNFVGHLKELRTLYPSAIIMAGNVATGTMTEELIHAGADIVKVGIGSGSVCETRLKTGVGVPQLSAIDECAFHAHGLGGHICADGGIVHIGDICKAFCAGADFVMLGSLLAGTDECDGEWILDDHLGKCVRYHGMASAEAQMLWQNECSGPRTPEGKEVLVQAKGPVRNVIRDIRGGLASCCTYIGCSEIKDMPKCAEFIRVNRTHNRIYG